MGWSQRYIMQQMARGRPLPTGQPEALLWQAAARMSLQDVEDAVSKGAHLAARDPQGRTLGHAWMDQAEQRRLAIAAPRVWHALVRICQQDPGQALARHPRTHETLGQRIARQAGREQIAWLLRHPATWREPGAAAGMGQLELLVRHADTALVEQALPATLAAWTARSSDGRTVREVWHSRAHPQPIAPAQATAKPRP